MGWLSLIPAAAGLAGKLFGGDKGKKVADIAGVAGSLLSGATKGRSEGRATEIGITQDQDAAALERARLAEQQAARMQRDRYDEARLDLDRRGYADTARSQGYDDRARGGLLQGLQDFQVQAPDGVPMGQISGGLRPSAIVNKEALGRDMERGAIQRELAGPNFSAVERVGGPQIPGLSGLPKAGKLDSFLNIASIVANLAGGAGQIGGILNGGTPAVGTTPNGVPPAQIKKVFGKVRF